MCYTHRHLLLLTSPHVSVHCTLVIVCRCSWRQRRGFMWQRHIRSRPAGTCDSVCTINAIAVFSVCLLSLIFWALRRSCNHRVFDARTHYIIIPHILCKYESRTLDEARAARPYPPLHVLTWVSFVSIGFAVVSILVLAPYRKSDASPFTVLTSSRRSSTKWIRACIYGSQFYLHIERNQIEIENIFVSLKAFTLADWLPCAGGVVLVYYPESMKFGLDGNGVLRAASASMCQTNKQISANRNPFVSTLCPKWNW